MVDLLLVLGAIPISLSSRSLIMGEGFFLIGEMIGDMIGAGAFPNLVFICLGLTSSRGFFSVIGYFLGGDGSLFLGEYCGFLPHSKGD